MIGGHVHQPHALCPVDKRQRQHRGARRRRRGRATLAPLQHVRGVQQRRDRRRRRRAPRVLPPKQLRRRLPELADLIEHRTLRRGVWQVRHVDGALIGERVEHVRGVDGGGAALLASEYEVDPLVQMRRHVVALKRLPAPLRTHRHLLCRLGLRGKRGQACVVCERTRASATVSDHCGPTAWSEVTARCGSALIAARPGYVHSR